MSPRAGVTVVFFINGALFASWASRIPALSDRVGATTGALGLALLAPAVAAIIAMPIVGRLLPGRSSRTFCLFSVAALMVAVLLPGLARSVPALALGLFAVGLCSSTMDLAMNAQGVAIERRMRRPILSSLHAAFSFGGFAGAALGAVAAALSVAPLPHLAFAAVLFGIPGLLAIRPLLRNDDDADAHAPALTIRRLPSRLALLGVACFFCLMAEGGSSDWSAKLVRDGLAGSAAIGAITYAVFSLAMASGRLVADPFGNAGGRSASCGGLARSPPSGSPLGWRSARSDRRSSGSPRSVSAWPGSCRRCFAPVPTSRVCRPDRRWPRSARLATSASWQGRH